ncbi:hypothetical protein M2283_004828 [Streptomyces pseudovenezuelae]|uniref:Major facilitator superfamily (MFS) profile domain-containing protein n=1 Tax=Streptomyces pseudovenezuelae TaxID=67350 RepID=A0ABT6LMG1_9ACTN|nr:hypothetical protein [Streptomyces pseudovenezuelae]
MVRGGPGGRRRLLVTILGPSLVAGLGIGLCFVPLGTAATAGVASEETGMASGLLNSSRQVGGAVGLGVQVTVAASVGGSVGGAQGLVDGFSAAYWVAAGLLAFGALAGGLLYGKTSLPAETYAAEKSSKNSGDRVDPAGSRSTQG